MLILLWMIITLACLGVPACRIAWLTVGPACIIWIAFNEEVDGHDVEAVQTALLRLKSCRRKAKGSDCKNCKRAVPAFENADLCHVMTLKPEIIDNLLGSAP